MSDHPTRNPERWRVRRGTQGDNYHAVPPSDCMILDTADHGACAYIVCRMNDETADRPEMIKRANLIAAAPAMRDALYKIAALDKHSGASLRQRAASKIARDALASLK